MSNYLERLIKLKKENPALTKVIECHFPETVSKDPYIYVGQYFIRTAHNHLYKLCQDEGKVYITNLTTSKRGPCCWGNSVKPSNTYGFNYLTESGWRELLKKSHVDPDQIRFIDKGDLITLLTDMCNLTPTYKPL